MFEKCADLLKKYLLVPTKVSSYELTNHSRNAHESYCTGNIGNANIAAHLNAGKLPADLQVLKLGMLKRGKGLKAEFHMVARTHGPILPDLADQIGSVGGGCVINVGMCDDQSAIIFAPPSGEDE